VDEVDAGVAHLVVACGAVELGPEGAVEGRATTSRPSPRSHLPTCFCCLQQNPGNQSGEGDSLHLSPRNGDPKTNSRRLLMPCGRITVDGCPPTGASDPVR
jgi:hypothetical protein